ncbi:nuclear transport factor 2 family protein [Candidatus Mycobacterium wuenschmannii]|uniref:Nuclear transport factor 2 family protein n=1 Tax=Candidatus Mycobacterium wuenschmannii TaxID=3027808 RepID=A0ABY8VV01_9MYCO|nr:nuclear transport factor 2 family protein [Candidatus Mycobacterium wuenschmannii]WIM87483.1 nuclear transport factor 2 family protein [Candidatus Mycobacterium wuenschmannii]
MQAITEQFVAALADLHRNRESGPIVDLFAEDAKLSKVGMPHHDQGKQGAREFWQRYREVFDAIDATFQRVATDDRVAFLEWTSEGTLKDGSDFRYQGVSVLEAEGDLIDSFRTYYDTAAFVDK